MKESQTDTQLCAALIHKIFETQAEQTPEATSIALDGQSLTYRELNRQANRVAHALLDLGVGPDHLVGIYAERSLQLIVGILGILKAGGAYVPLDPDYPSERLAFMIEDAKTSVILTHTKSDKHLPETTAKRLAIDAISRCGNDANPHAAVAPQQLAYVIYTSGSTGKPKGVMVTHENVVRLFRVTEPLFHFNSRDVWTLFHSPAFDFSVWEIWGTLFYGGKLLVIPHTVSRSPNLFYELLARENVTVLNQTPSAFKQLLQAEQETPRPLALRLVIFGGEALHPSLLKPWFARHGDCHPQMVNMYGITETTVHVTYRFLNSEDINGGSVIGVPLEDLEVRLFDEAHHPVPVGEPGEIHVCGPGVARGYLHRPELTAERFIRNPEDPASPARWYRSGDLARRLPDGSLEYLGRIDHQVKIRGFRIELGEIQAVIAGFDGVAQAAVTTREDAPGDIRLTAYIVPRRNARIALQPLYAHLKTKLPAYMTPAALILMDALPLNAHGKLDILALPAPNRSNLATSAEFTAPSTPEELAIATIWRELLHIDLLSADDNFFELGGHSLLAAQTIARMRAVFGIDLPVCAIFDLPTIRQLAARIHDALRANSAARCEPIPKLAPGTPPPLSFAQERLWFLHQLKPSSAAYNLPTALALHGAIHLPALQASLNEIIQRHEILRARFPAHNDAALQLLPSELHLPLPLIDLSALPPIARNSEVRRLINEDALRPFDLEIGPLIRASLLRLGPTHHVLLVNLHHLVADGWSLTILFHEWAALYGAYCQGIPSPLSALPIQYADYAAWQRASLRNEELTRQLAYWKTQLHAAPVFEMPTDRHLLLEPTYQGSKLELTLPASLARPLHALGCRENATLFMTLLAAFKLWLYRTTLQADISIGTPIAMRNRVELEGLIGFFINTLVLRTDLSGNPTFRELLGRIRKTALCAYAHQEVPFEKLVEELKPDRSLGRTPLFQIFFNLLNFADEKAAFPGLLTHRLPNVEATPKFDLTLYVKERGDGSIRFTAVYNTRLFRAERIATMLGQLELLLQQIVADPQIHLDAFSLVTPGARTMLPDPSQPLPPQWEGPLHEYFDKQAVRRAGHPAVLDASGHWTYRDLQTAANRLACQLLSSGCQREDIVAIYAHRSRPLMAALLGILKAGAAFLILDPAYPPARLAEYIRLAHPRGFLHLEAAGDLPAPLAECVNARQWNFRLTFPNPATEAIESIPPSLPVGPEDAAYIAFTSGSTGEPKAIAGSHRPLAHFMRWHAGKFGLCESDRFSLLSGLSHDPLLRDIFTPLTLGATLVIPSDEDRNDPVRLDAWLRKNQITIVHWTPAMEQLLGEAPLDATNPLPLRHAFFGGDTLTRRHLTRLRCRAPRVTCVNFYGTTETPQAMGYAFADPDDAGTEIIPLGRGIDGAQLLILNASQQLAGVGEPGEIYIRSPYLSRGYFHDESLTRARFLANPFTSLPGDRIYRTGDLGRYRSDGTVDFLGRMDRQIKLRGFRLEPGEIEALLTRHPLVLEAHIRLVGQPEPQLIAYVVPREKTPPDPAPVLRAWLKEQLPQAMVPAIFIPIPAIPLTPNGKVDAQSLPAPGSNSLLHSHPEVDAPVDTLEYQLQNIWMELLHVSPIGTRDNFFDLGGHSLLAARLFARIQKLTGCNLPLAALFQSPTIEQLAELIRRGSWDPLWATLVPIRPNGAKPPLFLMHPVGGNVLGYRDLASHLDKEMPVFGLQATGLRGTERPLHTVHEMAECYLKEIRALRPRGPYLLVGYSSGGIVAYEMAQQLRAQGQEVPLLVLLDTASSGHWKKPAPVRIAGHIHVLTQLPWDKKWSYAFGKIALIKQKVQDCLRRLAHAANKEEVLEEVRMANRSAILKYRPAPYPGRIILFRAKLRHQFYHEFTREPDESWRAFAHGGLVVQDIPCDHGQILGKQNVATLARELQKFVDEALRSYPA